MATLSKSPKFVTHSVFTTFSKKVTKKFRDMDENFRSVDRAFASLNRRLKDLEDDTNVKFEDVDKKLNQIMVMLETSLKKPALDFGSINAELAAQKSAILQHDRRIGELEGKS